MNIIEKNPKKIKSNNENDPKRFIETIATTSDGEVAIDNSYFLNKDKIIEEAKYDGLYSVCTNLEDKVEDIIEINKRRWEIEHSFRIMKSEFNARPVYLSREDRIKANFTTCFLSLIVYRYLEKKLDNKYTTSKIIETLRNMNMKFEINSYSPNYIRTDLTDKLHEKFQFRTDYEVTSQKNINKILKDIKK